MRKFYVITYEHGVTLYGHFDTYAAADEYARSIYEWDYTIEEYDNEDDYWDSI